MDELKEYENFSIELKTNDLDALKQLSEDNKTTIDSLIEEALRDILKKYNRD